MAVRLVHERGSQLAYRWPTCRYRSADSNADFGDECHWSGAQFVIKWAGASADQLAVVELFVDAGIPIGAPDDGCPSNRWRPNGLCGDCPERLDRVHHRRSQAPLLGCTSALCPTKCPTIRAFSRSPESSGTAIVAAQSVADRFASSHSSPGDELIMLRSQVRCLLAPPRKQQGQPRGEFNQSADGRALEPDDEVSLPSALARHDRQLRQVVH